MATEEEREKNKKPSVNFLQTCKITYYTFSLKTANQYTSQPVYTASQTVGGIFSKEFHFVKSKDLRLTHTHLAEKLLFLSALILFMGLGPPN